MNAEVKRGHDIPGWFWATAGLALLFEAFGCYIYVVQVSADPAVLPLDQRAMWDATPAWMIAAYAIAVWVGLIGAVLLLMRRKLAVLALLLSLVAVVVQFSGLFLVPQLRQTVPDTALVAPIALIVSCYLIFLLARLANRRGWLR
ncbi:MAG: hypothetical protein M3Q88_02535 [Pseudomonadota bacterium]|nr:hypothetical protein [Pseudomonadota bacterium]